MRPWRYSKLRREDVHLSDAKFKAVFRENCVNLVFDSVCALDPLPYGSSSTHALLNKN